MAHVGLEFRGVGLHVGAFFGCLLEVSAYDVGLMWLVFVVRLKAVPFFQLSLGIHFQHTKLVVTCVAKAFQHPSNPQLLLVSSSPKNEPHVPRSTICLSLLYANMSEIHVTRSSQSSALPIL